jgi:hypothetical protein
VAKTFKEGNERYEWNRSVRTQCFLRPLALNSETPDISYQPFRNIPSHGKFNDELSGVVPVMNDNHEVAMLHEDGTTIQEIRP